MTESATLKSLAIEHPYYCSDHNYFSNEAGRSWETMSEFLDEFEDADIDMNLVFRWDVQPRGESGAEAGRYYAEVFIMGQRKGLFLPHHIAHINEVEAKRFKTYLQRHWERMLEIWEPFSAAGNAILEELE